MARSSTPGQARRHGRHLPYPWGTRNRSRSPAAAVSASRCENATYVFDCSCAGRATSVWHSDLMRSGRSYGPQMDRDIWHLRVKGGVPRNAQAVVR